VHKRLKVKENLVKANLHPRFNPRVQIGGLTIGGEGFPRVQIGLHKIFWVNTGLGVGLTLTLTLGLTLGLTLTLTLTCESLDVTATACNTSHAPPHLLSLSSCRGQKTTLPVVF